MPIHRANKDKNFTVISNYHLQDKKLSLRAKGLLSLMLSLPNEWEYSINGLVSICKESEKTVEKALKELKDLGYLEVIKIPPNQSKTGRFEYSYEIFEKPKKQEGKKQGVEKQGVEKQGVEFYTQLNTKVLNTKLLNTKRINKENIKKSETKRFTKPTTTEVRDYAQSIDYDSLDANAFIDCYESKGWMIGNHMKDWKATVRNWKRRDNTNNHSKESNKSEVKNNYKTVEMPDYMKKQEKGDIVSTPVNEETLAKALELQRQFKENELLQTDCRNARS